MRFPCLISVALLFYRILWVDVLAQIVYILSIGIGLIGCIVASLAKTTSVLLGMRVLQAVGCAKLLSSLVLILNFAAGRLL